MIVRVWSKAGTVTSARSGSVIGSSRVGDLRAAICLAVRLTLDAGLAKSVDRKAMEFEVPVHIWAIDHILYGRFTRPWMGRVALAIVRGPREVILQLDDSKFSCPTTERYFWLGRHYEPDIAKRLLGSVSPNDVIYEIGAHFGYWVVPLAPRCRSIYAFEPCPENFRRLAENISRNRFTNAHAINAAVSAKAGWARLTPRSSISHVNDGGSISVPAVRLDDFLRDHPAPSIMLIDVEGYGGECLSGFSFHGHHPRILAEIHNPAEEKAMFGQLKDAGYHIQPLTKSSSYTYHIDAAPIAAPPG